ncbi:MAG: 5-carboxymethyl-2-hydroxymuconate isomerase [Rickettsiaceae bacterium]|jgi:5-carboxymethyl-2-hydroxymuconate isomerase|nr:5-carboxymethyl-2-hydroxymuconate isomerase [Rickettsiaceae bacterium]
MPHIVIEYSDNLANEVKSTGLTKLLHQTVVDSGLFSPDAVKARSVAFSDYVLIEGAKDFIHVTVSILSGRTQQQRKDLNESVFQTVKKAIPTADKVSSDIREMDGAVYKK